ncbi:hypothetical protein EON81_18735 [bacterium]|nr:MAG: hypothetical protein EON81_18735 [bacterium]
MLKPLLAFAVWVGYGIWRARSSGDLRAGAFALPRNKRLAQGMGYLLLSLVAGLGPIGGAMLLSFQNGGKETMAGWGLILIGGLLLVHLQIIGVTFLAATMVEDRVTERQAETSVEESSSE